MWSNLMAKLTKHCLRLMLSNGPKHVLGRADETHTEETRSPITSLFIWHAAARHAPSFHLHLSFSLLSLNTSLFLPSFLPSHFSARQRKLEMQEHIVTVGCFHLHSRFWHGRTRPTSARQIKTDGEDKKCLNIYLKWKTWQAINPK